MLTMANDDFLTEDQPFELSPSEMEGGPEEEYQGRAWGDVTPYPYKDIDCSDNCPGCITSRECTKTAKERRKECETHAPNKEYLEEE